MADRSMGGGFTPGPWEYVPSDQYHGAYVEGPFGGDICDCYTMSNPSVPSVRNGGTSKPIPFQHEQSDANARLISAAPDMFAALKGVLAVADRATVEFDAARAALAKAVSP